MRDDSRLRLTSISKTCHVRPARSRARSTSAAWKRCRTSPSTPMQSGSPSESGKTIRTCSSASAMTVRGSIRRQKCRNPDSKTCATVSKPWAGHSGSTAHWEKERRWKEPCQSDLNWRRPHDVDLILCRQLPKPPLVNRAGRRYGASRGRFAKFLDKRGEARWKRKGQCPCTIDSDLERVAHAPRR